MRCARKVRRSICRGATKGYQAFYGCSSLKSISIPKNVNSIGARAFNNCDNLKEFIIDEQNEYLSIVDGVIYDKERTKIIAGVSSVAKDITIPDSVTSIGYGVFSNCDSLISITIPNSVTSIGEYAFNGCSSLTSVTIPDSVTSIGYGVFSGCSSLTRITMPDSVTSIPSQAFFGCSSLTNITIPDSVTLIGSSAFSYCSSLKSISIPKNVNSIGARAFNNCDNLKEFIIDEQNEYLSIVDGVIYDKERTKIIASVSSVAKDITIPDSVTSIGDYALSDFSGLKSIAIPNGVTHIGDGAFSGCYMLTSVIIPDSVTNINSYAFWGCSSLTSITIPNSITEIGQYAFLGCESLDIVFNDSNIVLKIGSTDNGYIAYYASIVINNGGSFQYINNGYEYIETSDGFIFDQKDGEYRLLAYIGDLDKVTLPLHINGHSYSNYAMVGFESVIIPEGVTSIRDKEFYNCCSLKSIIIPESVTSIGNQAFQDCISLTSITIPESVTIIGDQVFQGCISLTSITIPDNITNIPFRAFSGCITLTNITIPESVTNISYAAFYDCISLKSITIPEGVTAIGAWAFCGCSNLINMKIPCNVTSIDDYTFYNCGNLTSIKIPDSVTNIGKGAFKNTGIYNNLENWNDGYLYCDGWIVGIDDTINYTVAKSTTRGIASYIYDENTNIKFTYGDCIGTTNVESTVIWNKEIQRAKEILVGSVWNDLPLTFKNCIIASNSTVTSSYAFSGITGITIWVEANEKDCRWDENFPGWNNGNRVVYGEDWSYTNFYDVDGNLIFKEPRLNSKIVIQPYYRIESDAQYDYKTGWDLDGDGIADPVPATSTNEINAYAVITERILRSYTVTFEDHDGTVISSCVYNYGEMPVIPADPSRESPEPNVYIYKFIGWSSEVSPVTGETVYTAQYQKDYVEYTVKFVDYNGDLISETTYHYGDTVTVPSNPSRAADNIYTYTFDKWTPSVTAVTGDATYTAEYTATYIDYTVRFVDYNGDLISETTYHYSDTVTVPDDPNRASDETYYYVFTGWTPEITAVTGDAEYTAVYEAKAHDWSEPTYEWTADHSKATASRYSKNDPSIVQTETVQAVVTRTEPSCEQNGKITYTATFANPAFRAQVYEETIPATGHSYGEPEWIWSEDHETAEARFTCSVCHNTVTVNAAVTIVQNGNINTYTAKVTFNGKEYTDTVTVQMFIYGDANGDGIVNGKDLICLRKYLATYDDDTGTAGVEIGAGADMNGDGVVNGKDIIRLRKFLLEIDNGTSTVTTAYTAANEPVMIITVFDKRLLQVK